MLGSKVSLSLTIFSTLVWYVKGVSYHGQIQSKLLLNDNKTK